MQLLLVQLGVVQQVPLFVLPQCVAEILLVALWLRPETDNT